MKKYMQIICLQFLVGVGVAQTDRELMETSLLKTFDAAKKFSMKISTSIHVGSTLVTRDHYVFRLRDDSFFLKMGDREILEDDDGVLFIDDQAKRLYYSPKKTLGYSYREFLERYPAVLDSAMSKISEATVTVLEQTWVIKISQSSLTDFTMVIDRTSMLVTEISYRSSSLQGPVKVLIAFEIVDRDWREVKDVIKVSHGGHYPTGDYKSYVLEKKPF